MSKKKSRWNCKSCGDPIYLSKEESDLINEGFTGPPDKCDDCHIDDGYSDEMIQDFSDADPGL